MAKLFSVKLYKTRDQYEICTTIFENVSFNGVLVYVCIIEPSHQCRRALNDDWTSLTHDEQQHLDRSICLANWRHTVSFVFAAYKQEGHSHITYPRQHRCDCLDIDHLLRYEWNFTGGAGHSLLWLEATTFLNYIYIYLSDHLLKYGRNVAGGGGNSLLWPEATSCLNHLGAYSRPKVDIVVYGPRPHCFI